MKSPVSTTALETWQAPEVPERKLKGKARKGVLPYLLCSYGRDLGLYTEPWNSHTAHHARTVLFHSHNRDLYRDQAYNEKQGRLEREISPCHHTETLRILGKVLVTVHRQKKTCSTEYDRTKWFIFSISQTETVFFKWSLSEKSTNLSW